MDTAPAAAAARAVPARLDARGRRRARATPPRRSPSSSPCSPARPGATLIEPEGRRVRLTPGRAAAGRARGDHPGRGRGRPRRPRPGAPSRPARCGSPASPPRSGARCCPWPRGWRAEHPAVRLRVHEHEPAEAFALLAADDVDLALVYDYNLAPRRFDRDAASATPLWAVAWGLGVPGRRPAPRGAGDAPDVFRRFRGRRLDRQLPQHRRRGRRAHHRLAGRLRAADRAPRRQPRAGPGPDRRRARRRACCPPTSRRPRASALLDLREPAVALRAYAVTRRGREGWPPLALVLRMLAPG